MKFTGRVVLTCMVLTMLATALVTLVVVHQPIAVTSRPGAQTDNRDKGFTPAEYKKLSETLKIIEDQYYSDVDRAKIIDGAVNGMMDALKDPYSVYMNANAAHQLLSTLEGTYSGIGAEVTMVDDQVTVLAPIKDTPADRAGILPKDVFVSVNGQKLEGLKLNDAIGKIRGPKGSKAKITVKRVGVSDMLEFEVVRSDINMETVYGAMLEHGIGKIEVRQFAVNTAERFTAELNKLEHNGLKGLIIDVRNNPGGFVPVAESIAEHFVPAGEVLYQQERRNEEKIPTLSKGKGAKSYPIVVLINEGSASASEIVAGALQDNHLAKLVGVTSFGKGTMQMTYPEQLGDGSMLKMTIAKWLTPAGSWVHKLGIKPDVAVKEPDYYFASRLSKKEELIFDMNSDDVKNAQIMLDGLSYEPGRKDGYFDEATKQAVQAFQQHTGLQATGTIDKMTAGKLEEAIKLRLNDPDYDTQLIKAIELLRQEIK